MYKHSKGEAREIFEDLKHREGKRKKINRERKREIEG